MERTFKHIITNKTIIIGGQTGESMQKLISSKASDLTIQDIIVNSSEWEEIIDKNPLKLEVGKEYILQYVHSKSKPQHVKITHFTDQGYPWQERVRDGGCKGIVSPDCYRLIEEVIEKDYEILSFITNMKVEFDINDDKTYSHRKHIRYSLKEMLEDDGLKIYSVKRLSDGEIFTVGDNIKSIYWDDVCKPTIIEGFHINDNMDCKPIGAMIIEVKGYCRDKSNWLSLEKSVKYIKKPLFTTEDGVDIYEGDRYYGVELGIYRFINDIACKNVTYTNTANIYFSTKKAAENYIILNKPCLSINDVLSKTEYPGNWCETLKELVKSKLSYV